MVEYFRLVDSCIAEMKRIVRYQSCESQHQPKKIRTVREVNVGISWSPGWTSEKGESRPNWVSPKLVEVPKPLKLVPVHCLINRHTGYQPKWDFADLYFYPKQKYVPLLLSDSMCNDVQRHPVTMHIIRGGATAGQLNRCFMNMHEEIAKRVPFKLWVILVGGGNDLCGANPASSSAERLAKSVTNNFEELDAFCYNKGYRLTISHVMPRPREQGEKTPNPLEVRRNIADALNMVHQWTEWRNEKINEVPLILNRFLEHRDESSGRIRRYKKTGQQKIRENRFAADGVHLVGQGVEDIQSAIHQLVESTF